MRHREPEVSRNLEGPLRVETNALVEEVGAKVD